MSFSPVPRYYFREITHITPSFLAKLGVKLLMLDLDNTIASYDEHSPSGSVSRWTQEMKDSAIELFIVSNSVRIGRVESFAKALGIKYKKGASKPSPKGVRQVMAEAGFSASESALAGDQIYTDTLAANRAGVLSIIVRPRRFTNPFLALRYALEAPFRALCKYKNYAARIKSHTD